MSTHLDAVLFDLDGTLCRYERSSAELLALAFDRVGVEPFFDRESYYDRFEAFVDDSEDMASLRADCFAALARERGRDPALGRAVADAFAAERDHSRVEFLDGAERLLTGLSGYNLGLVTNGHAGMQRAKLDALGIADSFDVTVFAGSRTRSKPHPDPFEAALGTLDARPEAALFVGDSLDADIRGARGVGMEAAWVAGDGTPAGRATPDYVLDSPADLTGVLSAGGSR